MAADEGDQLDEDDEAAFERRAGDVIGRLSASPLGARLRAQRPTAIDRDALLELLHALHGAGLVGVAVPTDLGGQGLAPAHQAVVDRLLDELELPTDGLTVHLRMCVPTLLEWASPALRAAHVPRMLRGDEYWCQMFSEPDAGSDVASIRTTARLDGDGWVLAGEKVWTSWAHVATHGLVIARTDASVPKHAGLSAFAVALDQPGVTVEPITAITGHRDFNAVHLDDVVVPAAAMIGSPGDGWSVALTMLMNERTYIGARSPAMFDGYAQQLVDVARAAGRLGEPAVRQRIAHTYTDQRILSWAGQRRRALQPAGVLPGPEGSLGKLGFSQFLKRVTGDAMAITGPAAIAWPAGAGGDEAQATLEACCRSIAGGTTEIQRSIVAERLLGLPRDDDVTKTMPFTDILRLGVRGR